MENKEENNNENNINPKENEIEQEEEKKKDEEEKEKIEHTVVTQNQELPITRNKENNNEIIEEEEKNNKEEKKSEEEKKVNNNGNNQINNKISAEDRLKIEKYFEDILTKMISTWENDRDNFGYFYHKELYPFLYKMVERPCIVGFQEIISHSFNFLCNYFSFLKDKLSEIPIPSMLIVNWIFSQKVNLFSLYPKFNFMDEFDEKCELIGDNFFYYLLHNINPEIKLENPQLGYSHNCMLKYLLEYTIQIGFLDNYINIFLEREDLKPFSYIKFTNYVFEILNFCEEKFLIKHNYKYNFDIVKNFAKKMNIYSKNVDIYLEENKESKDEYINFIKCIEKNYYLIIFGSLGRALEIYQKEGREKEVDDFINSIFSLCLPLLKKQKLELRVLSINILNNYANNYKIYFNDLEKYYSSPKSVYEYTKKKFVSFLKKLNIFDIIFGENIHEALIERSNDILVFLYNNNLLKKEQIFLLWKISKTKSQSISNSIINLFGRILPEFSKEDCQIILKEILNTPLKEVNEVILKLFENFFLSENRYEMLLKILFKYSNELSFYEGLSINIINKSRNLLVKLLFNMKYKDDLIHCIKNCIFCLNNNYLLNTNMNLLIDIINEFNKNEKDENVIVLLKYINEKVNDFNSFISILDDKYSFFSVFMENLYFLKKFFVFLIEEGINIKKKFDENNSSFNFDDIINIDNIIKIYIEKYTKEENDKLNVIAIKEKDINNNKEKEIKLNNDLLPKNEDDIYNYYKQIIKEFIEHLKNNILKKDILITEKEMITNIFTKFEFSYEKSTYHKILSKIIDTIFSFHEFGNIYINPNLINFLYKFLVNNCLYEKEKETFFNFIKNILVYQFNNYNLNLLTEDVIDDLCLKKISSNEIIFMPYSAYESMNLYMIYKNEKNGNIVYSHNENKFLRIKNIKLLIGFKTILKFYINNDNPTIAVNSLETLTNIIEIASSDMINRKYILTELFSLLEKNNKKEKATPLRRILRLISIVNKTKVTENLYDKNDPNNILNISINNDFLNNNNQDNLQEFHAFKGLTVKEFKDELIDNLLCKNSNDLFNYNYRNQNPHSFCQNSIQMKNEIINQDLILLYYGDKKLKNEFTLADYGINNGDIILLLNRCSIGIESDNYNINPTQLKECVDQVNVVFNSKYEEDLIKQALINNKGDIENTIIFLTEEKNVEKLKEEVKIKKEEEPEKKEEQFCLDEKQFNLLLNILNEEDSQLNDTIWDLFSEIKFQDEFIYNSIENEFGKIFEEKNLNKIILILKIINSVIFDDNTFCKSNKISKEIKNNWISKFLKNNEYIHQLLIYLSSPKDETNYKNNYLDIINIFLNYFKKIFVHIIEINKQPKNNIINENEIKEKKENEKFDMKEEDIYIFLEILSKNNFLIYIYKIFSNITELSKYQYTFVKKTIIKNIFNITLDYLKIIPKEVELFLNEEKNFKKILTILILEKEEEIRKHTLDFLKKLINKHKDDKNIDIQLMIMQCYYPYLISEEVYFEQFYELYDYLFNLRQVKSDEINIQEIISKLFQHIYLFYSNYKNPDNSNDNINKNKKKIEYNLYILACFSPFYDDLIKKELDIKIEENKNILNILYDCLFTFKKLDDNINYIFDKKNLRENAFKILSNIISLDKKYFDFLWQKMNKHHVNIILKKTEFPLAYPLRDFKLNKFIGLKNFGATCYLNSLFQQMFMIPTFYTDIFKFNIYEKIKEIKNLDECTLYKMQLTFLNLKKSIMWAYPPISFIQSFKKAFNGEPIKFGVQQDTDEFLSILSDKLEKEAKIFGKENFLENSFKGKITNEIVSLEEQYPYYSQSEEPFYSITLDIKNHKNLEEALDAYVKGETLEGENKYFVEKYNKKISIKKRNSLKKIGNQIIIHLKGFEFDFYTFENNKLNDYLEFPKNINLKKWTRAYIRTNEINNINENNITQEEKENLDDNKMEYELTGIIIHSGSNLQSGHYYSLIKSQDDNKWYKFNDNEISEYDINANLEKECFGNLEAKVNLYGKGAYLLFYTKKECIEKYKDYDKKIDINEKLLKEIEDENIHFLKLKAFSDDFYHNFFMIFINNAINYLSLSYNEKDEIIDINSLMNDNIKKNIEISDKIINYCKEKNINVDINEPKLWPENIKEIYLKVKKEINNSDNENKSSEININEKLNLKNVINIFCFYFFGIVLQYNDKEEFLMECIKFLQETLQKYSIFVIDIMKIIEIYNTIISNLIFKYNHSDKRKADIIGNISEFFITLFKNNYMIEFETYKICSFDTYDYFIMDKDGKLKEERTYKSLFLRLFKILFCENLEKCKKEPYLFLSLFCKISQDFPISNIVSSEYLNYFVYLITNYKIDELSNISNKNNNKFSLTEIKAKSLKIFCQIILSCKTPSMILLQKESPYLALKLNDLSIYPKLPLNFEKIYTKEFIIYFLLNNNEETLIEKMLCHLCWEDDLVSERIMFIVNSFLKNNFYLISYPFIENAAFNVAKIFNVNDKYIHKRLETLFELEDDENYTLIKYYIDNKYKNSDATVGGLYIISKIIEKYDIAFEYFKKNKNKLEWVKEYYVEFFEGKFKLSFIDKVHPDIFSDIETQIINRLEI